MARSIDSARVAIRSGWRSLIRKITLPTVVLVLVVSSVSTAILGWIFAHTHEAHAEERAQRFAAVVEDTFRKEMENRHTDLGAFLQLLCRATLKSAFVTDHSGNVRFACDPTLTGTRLEPAEIETRRLDHDGKRWLRRVRAIAGGPRCAACHDGADPVGYLGVDASVEEAEVEVREQQRLNLAAGSLLALVLIAVLVPVQLAAFYRPVRRLASTVARIRAGDLAARVPSSNSGDEIDLLGQSLNDMAASIERAKQELARTHRAELTHASKLAALGQMVSTVAHEIKNPLTGIIGALRVLQSTESIPEAERAVIVKILAQVDRLSRTVVSALDQARPMRPVLTQVDLVDLLDRVIFFVEGEAAQRKVVVRKCHGLDVACVRADPDLIRQVLLNLILNGIQAMSAGGTLGVTVRAGEPGTVELVVSDQGAGIPADLLPRLFTPFFSTRPGGTGLGLHVARQIVETHGGRIEVESRPGEGTAFTVTLPREEVALAAS